MITRVTMQVSFNLVTGENDDINEITELVAGGDILVSVDTQRGTACDVQVTNIQVN